MTNFDAKRQAISNLRKRAAGGKIGGKRGFKPIPDGQMGFNDGPRQGKRPLPNRTPQQIGSNDDFGQKRPLGNKIPNGRVGFNDRMTPTKRPLPNRTPPGQFGFNDTITRK